MSLPASISFSLVTEPLREVSVTNPATCKAPPTSMSPSCINVKELLSPLSPALITRSVSTVTPPASRLEKATSPYTTVDPAMPAVSIFPAWVCTSTLPRIALSLPSGISAAVYVTPSALNTRNVFLVLVSVTAFPLAADTVLPIRTPFSVCTILPFSEASPIWPPPV